MASPTISILGSQNELKAASNVHLEGSGDAIVVLNEPSDIKKAEDTDQA